MRFLTVDMYIHVATERWSDGVMYVMISVSVYSEYQCLSSQVGDTPLMRAAWIGNTKTMAS